MKLHEKIVALRKAAGLTQSKLGEMLNVSAQAVSKWENNECLPDLTLLPALCAALHVSADELLEITPQTASNRGKALVRADRIYIRSKQGVMLDIAGADALRSIQHTEAAALRELLDLLSDDTALRIFRALSFTAIGFEEEIAAHCGFAVEETRAAIFRLLKQEICQCAPEGYVLGANAYLVWAAFAAAWLASPDGRDDVGEITVSYSSRT